MSEYGSKGIDTEYERGKVNYQPKIQYPKKEYVRTLSPETMLLIERSKEFTISQALIDYDDLIHRIHELMGEIQTRFNREVLSQFERALQEMNWDTVRKLEDEYGDHRGTSDLEIYTILYFMGRSCERRREFLDQHFRTQITTETDMEDIKEKELEKIEAWLETEYESQRLEDELFQLYAEEDHDEEIVDEKIEQQIALLQQKIEDMDIEKREKRVFHTTLADTGYIHRNRTALFFELLDQISVIVQSPEALMQDNMEDFIFRIGDFPDYSLMVSYLILRFRSIKDQHNRLKGKYILIEDSKEDYISEQQWFYQQIESKANEKLYNWLYNQDIESETVMDEFLQILAYSIKETKEKYDVSNQDILKFYQMEASFYNEQISLIRKKEKIRQFIKIIEELKDAEHIDDKWVSEYVKANKYSN